MTKGWKQESLRHSLSAKGIETTPLDSILKNWKKKPRNCYKCGKDTWQNEKGIRKQWEDGHKYCADCFKIVSGENKK